MKREIALLLLIFGLTVMEYGCGDESGRRGRRGENRVTGVEDTYIVEIDTFGQEIKINPDSVHSKDFKIQTSFVDAFFTAQEYSNSALFAAPALPAPIYFPLDSIVIRNTLNLDSVDLTKAFDVSIGGYDYYYSGEYYAVYRFALSNDSIFQEETTNVGHNGQVVLDFFMIEQSTDTLDYRLQLTFYASNGDVFTSETPRFIILPE